jgi:hypothetical protein
LEAIYSAKREPARQKPDAIVACLGDQFAATCARTIEQLDTIHGRDAIRFVYDEWQYQPTATERARIVWLVDQNVGIESAQARAQHGDRLLVPEANPALVNFCTANGAGLFYSDEFDGASALQYLVQTNS